MNTQETHEIVVEINDGMKSIQRRINVNTVIFSVIAMIVIYVLFQGWKLSKAQERNYNLATESLKLNAKTNAKLQASDEIYLTYIKTTVSAMWDKLQKDNPQLKVPKPPPPRPAGLPPPTEKELERPKSEGAGDGARASPAPTPIVKTKTVIKYRPRPTLPPWWVRWFSGKKQP